MLMKNKTRIFFLNGEVVIVTPVPSETIRCRVFVDGMEMGYLIKLNGTFIPENNCHISTIILDKINDLAIQAEAA